MTSATRVALYGRVSTTDKGQDPQVQLRELREYCERRGWKISEEYVDAGKMKGGKANGTCKAKANPDQSTSFDCMGTYTPATT